VIFTDSSFWIAALVPRDRHHQEALMLLELAAREQLMVTNHILGETWTYLRNKAGHRRAVEFIERAEGSKRITSVHVSEDLEQQALRWLRRHDERVYSFVDATSFALMRSMKIREALAFDGDFAAAGFRELRP
jgi:predicted nucleic acid-binding protein